MAHNLVIGPSRTQKQTVLGLHFFSSDCNDLAHQLPDCLDLANLQTDGIELTCAHTSIAGLEWNHVLTVRWYPSHKLVARLQWLAC
jgi:hypothetical protein